MEIKLNLSFLNLQYLFKIDLIVWKFIVLNYMHMLHIVFKIDLIVWKSIVYQQDINSIFGLK